MSVAFTREEDVEAAAAHLPDRPVSQHPNLVTERGLALLDESLVSARSAFAAAQAEKDIQGDRTAMARAARDLRYFAARRATAQLLEPDKAPGTVTFGSGVRFKREDGRIQTFRIVGEDEAEPANGSISHVSPLARALLGKKVGEFTLLSGGELEILAVD